jgi:apolipoprotein N-acyltransferase
MVLQKGGSAYTSLKAPFNWLIKADTNALVHAGYIMVFEYYLSLLSWLVLCLGIVGVISHTNGH